MLGILSPLTVHWGCSATVVQLVFDLYVGSRGSKQDLKKVIDGPFVKHSTYLELKANGLR